MATSTSFKKKHIHAWPGYLLDKGCFKLTASPLERLPLSIKGVFGILLLYLMNQGNIPAQICSNSTVPGACGNNLSVSINPSFETDTFQNAGILTGGLHDLSKRIFVQKQDDIIPLSVQTTVLKICFEKVLTAL